MKIRDCVIDIEEVSSEKYVELLSFLVGIKEPLYKLTAESTHPEGYYTLLFDKKDQVWLRGTFEDRNITIDEFINKFDTPKRQWQL